MPGGHHSRGRLGNHQSTHPAQSFRPTAGPRWPPRSKSIRRSRSTGVTYYLKIESRTNGQQQIWKIIEHVVSIQDGTPQFIPDDKAINILTESKITLLNGSIQMCLDSRLNKYEVPIFCINAPDKYSEELIEDRNLNYEYDDKTMEISIRSTKYPNGDIKMSEKAST